MFVVAMVGEACDCTGRATIPGAADCLTAADCAPNETCRDGRCVAGLALGEGEGEGEGEPAEGEGEGEGEAEPVDLIVAPTSLTLPQTDVGVAVTGTAQLVNVGGGPVTLGALTSNDPRFVVIAPAAGLVIDRNASETLTVRFTATEAGAASTTITVAVAQPSGSASPVLTVSGSAPLPPVDGGFAARAGPDDSSLGLPGCQCRPEVPPALVRVSYEAVGGGTCRRPSNPACARDDNCSPCSLGAFGEARWHAPRFVVNARTNEDWIVDEEISHGGDGTDGDFIAKVSLIDDCQALLAGQNNNTDFGCCIAVDCITGGDFACYPYQEPISCSTDCNFFVSTARNDGECMQRGPITVRARLTLDDDVREFCGTMTRDQTIELARVQRRNGAFTITQVAASFTELAAVGDPCD